MRTYFESINEDVSIEGIDWELFLNKDVESYTPDEIREASIKSGSWVTCACGNQCDIIPRRALGAPMDYVLYSLGADFTHAIQGIEYYTHYKMITELKTMQNSAKNILQKIEERSAELIKEITEASN